LYGILFKSNAIFHFCKKIEENNLNVKQ